MTKKQTSTKKAPKKPADPVAGPGEIVIRNGNGPAVVKAETLHEFFAMHKPLGGKTGHTLTHVPSGYSIGTYRTRLLAMWVAQQLRAFGGAELWQFTDPNHMGKHADKMLLTRLRRLADPTTAEQDMKDGALTPQTKKPVKFTPLPDPYVDNAARRGPLPAATPKYSAPWRSGVDWVAAGKKAYETRLRNLAAKQASPAPQAQASKAPRPPQAQASPAPQAQAPKASRPPQAQASPAPQAQASKAPRPPQAQASPAPKAQAPKAPGKHGSPAPQAPPLKVRGRRAPVAAGARS